jgi:hypothetical protein
MGCRSADTAFDGWVYGLAVGMGDGLKALSPFVGAWGFRHRDYLASGAAVLVFVVFTAYSFTAALGFAAEHRASKASTSLDRIERHADLRHQYDRNEQRLGELGTQRTPEEVKGAIIAALNKPAGKGTVARISDNCRLNRAAIRTACAHIGKLQQELARANEAAALTKAQGDLRHALNAIPGGTAASDDPQEDALQRVARVATVDVDRKSIGSFLAFLLALLIEFGSGMGLYIATTPWRARAEEIQAEEPKPNRQLATAKVQAATLVDAYALERLEPHEQSEVTVADLFADYLVWCRWRRQTPLSRAAFTRAFEELARAAGIGKGTGQRYRRVKLIGRS